MWARRGRAVQQLRTIAPEAREARRWSGVVRLTLPMALSELAFASLHAFVERHPEVEVEALTSDTLVDLNGRHADVAVRIADAPPDTWSSVWILTRRELRPSGRVRALSHWLARSMRAERGRIEGTISASAADGKRLDVVPAWEPAALDQR